MGRREHKIKTRGSAGQHKKGGDDFLAINAKKPGIEVTDSGLQYLVIDKVNGIHPDDYSKVLMHHRILLLNGTVLADTYKTNTPVEELFGELIDGIKEGLMLMGEGSRFKFWVPPELAWGRKGTSNKIPPNAVLFFDIRLLKVG